MISPSTRATKTAIAFTKFAVLQQELLGPVIETNSGEPAPVGAGSIPLARIDVAVAQEKALQTVCVEIYFQESKRHRLKKKNLGENRGFPFSTQEMDLVAHSAHAAARHRRMRRVLLRQLGNHGLGGDQEAGDRGRVLQRAADDLGRVDNALRDEVAVLPGLSVEAEGVVAFSRILPTTTEPSSPAFWTIWRDGVCSALRTIVDAGLLVLVVGLEVLEAP